MTDRPTEQHPFQRWEQPDFSDREPQAPVWGPVLVPAEAVVVPAPGAQEQSLQTIRRLLFPVALVLAIVTGDWLPVLVLALVANAVLKRRLWFVRQQRLALAGSLR